MEKIYEHSDDLHVKALKVYAKASDEFGYVDAACEVKVTANELHNAFIKGMIIVDAEGVKYKPVSCKLEDSVVTVMYVTAGPSIATIKSA